MTALKTAWLFPGQGSQYVGMGWGLLRDFPPAAEIMGLASEISGRDLQKLCLRGPDRELTRTDNLQPAITAINLGCARLLQDAGYRPDCVAGHSLGEFSALHVAGVLTLEDTLSLVAERGRLMHEASLAVPSGMLAIKNLHAERVEAIAAQLEERYPIAVANYNAPQQTVLSGAREAIQMAQALVLEQGGKAVSLNVSGAWHSPLMREAAALFVAALERATFHAPRLPVFMNVTGSPGRDAEEIQSALRRQIQSPVRWNPLVAGMIDAGVATFVEVGPGKVLRGLLALIWPTESAYRAVGVEGPQSLRFLKESREASA